MEKDNKTKIEKNKNIMSKKIINDIKHKVKYNDEGDEAIGDFTYDALFRKKENYKEIYDDYKD